MLVMFNKKKKKKKKKKRDRESFESVFSFLINTVGYITKHIKYKSLKKMNHAFIIDCRPMV